MFNEWNWSSGELCAHGPLVLRKCSPQLCVGDCCSVSHFFWFIVNSSYGHGCDEQGTDVRGYFPRGKRTLANPDGVRGLIPLSYEIFILLNLSTKNIERIFFYTLDINLHRLIHVFIEYNCILPFKITGSASGKHALQLDQHILSTKLSFLFV